MAKIWEKPLYELRAKSGKNIIIDVTTSVSPGLPPNKVVIDLIPFLKGKKVEKILDFGAGALRHTLPLLDHFQICAVEFEENFSKPACSKALSEAEQHSNFSKLIYPKDFVRDVRKFDAAFLCYVLQTMPLAEERKLVLKHLRKKLNEDAFVLYMSRWNQMDGASQDHRVTDGYYKYPDRDRHTFYREFTTEETHELLKEFRFTRIRSLSARGNDQIFLYAKGGATWI